MKNRLLIISLVVPWVCLVGWAVWLSTLRANGTEVTVRITGYDTLDILSGRYLSYQIDWDETDCAQFPDQRCPNDGFCHESMWRRKCRFYVDENKADRLKKLFSWKNRIFEVVYFYVPGQKPIAKQLLIDGKDWEEFVEEPEGDEQEMVVGLVTQGETNLSVQNEINPKEFSEVFVDTTFDNTNDQVRLENKNLYLGRRYYEWSTPTQRSLVSIASGLSATKENLQVIIPNVNVGSHIVADGYDLYVVAVTEEAWQLYTYSLKTREARLLLETNSRGIVASIDVMNASEDGRAKYFLIGGVGRDVLGDVYYWDGEDSAFLVSSFAMASHGEDVFIDVTDKGEILLADIPLSEAYWQEVYSFHVDNETGEIVRKTILSAQDLAVIKHAKEFQCYEGYCYAKPKFDRANQAITIDSCGQRYSFDILTRELTVGEADLETDWNGNFVVCE